MNPRVPLLLLALIALPAAAQQETARHREVYQQVNDALPHLRSATATLSDDGVTYEVRAWFDGATCRKITTTDRKSGGTDEIYLEAGRPLFIYRSYRPLQDDGSRGARIEERLYFKDGTLFRWLTTEKPEPVFHAEDYRSMEDLFTRRIRACLAKLPPADAPADKPGTR